MENNKLKILLGVLIISSLLLSECLSVKPDEEDSKDRGEEEEHFETHLWSRLSKDHSSSRDKRDTPDQEENKGIHVNACCVFFIRPPPELLPVLGPLER